MNPVFVFLIFVGVFAAWFLLSFAFYPLGKIIYQIWKDAVDEINKEDESEEKEE